MPADIKEPDMNSGEPWSEMDIADLARRSRHERRRDGYIPVP